MCNFLHSVKIIAFFLFFFDIFDIMSKKQKQKEIKLEPFRKTKSLKRTLIKRNGTLPEDAIHGEIISTVGSIYYVKADEKLFECVIGGTLISKYDSATLAATGDEVWFTLEESLEKNENKGTIKKIGKRWTKLSRRVPSKYELEQILAANADQLVILMSAMNPEYNKRLIDRYQIAAELGDLKVVICINKLDLLTEEEIEIISEDLDVYKNLGDEIIFISAHSNLNIEVMVEKYLMGKTSIFSGPSGVGKSTLVNKILGAKIQAVNEISDFNFKGKHTTSFTKMFELPQGGRIIDTPGIREFGLWDITREELPLFFRDFNKFYLDCKYTACTHTHEPGCAVIKALEEGKIEYERYESYINLYETLK